MRIGRDAQIRHHAPQGIDGRLELLNDTAELRSGVLALSVLPQAAAQFGLQQRQPVLWVRLGAPVVRQGGRGPWDTPGRVLGPLALQQTANENGPGW